MIQELPNHPATAFPGADNPQHNPLVRGSRAPLAYCSAGDDERHTEKDVQKLHDEAIEQLDNLVKAKETEIMEV